MSGKPYPTPAVIDAVIDALNPALRDQDAKLRLLVHAMEINREETVGAIFGITAGILDAVEARTHGLITAQEVYDELATGIRCRMAAAMITDPDL